MDFSSKMDFLMKLTQTTNKELAAEISVDRSLISLLRTGRRGIPHNKLHIRNMAASFAKRVHANFQRQALAEVSGKANLRAEVSPDVLAAELEHWLLGDTDSAAGGSGGTGGSPEGAGGSSKGADRAQDEADRAHEDADRTQDEANRASEGAEQNVVPLNPNDIKSMPFATRDTHFFYGDEGRRDALRFLMNLGGLRESAISIFNNTDIGWILSDRALTADIQAASKHHTERGSDITQILPPLSDIGSFTDSLRFLLPLYAKGNVKAYCSPRLAEPPFAVLVIIVRGRYVLISHGSRSGASKAITVVSADREFVNAHAEQFRDYLSLCRPAMETHRKPREFLPTISRFLSLKGEILQKTSTLSALSMPNELLRAYEAQSDSPERQEYFRIMSAKAALLEKRLLTEKRVDICRLHTVQEIRTGKIPVAFPYIPFRERPFYTAETYAVHLENILRLLERYRRYTFVPVFREPASGCDLLVNDGGTALLVHGDAPSSMILEFRRPEIVAACREYLLRIVDEEGFAADYRDRVKARLGALIRELREEAPNDGA